MDVVAIISAVGGRAEAARLAGLSANSVLYWERRKSIPSRHLLKLIKAAEANGFEASGLLLETA